ncbi:alcohol dehydrogenase catalytic domain-containing protein [[Clostridium] scindens]|uniref:zinc-dependent alcohol dehydrogenase n=1 Tax=Clostridium scindens (strain JCM 10418 / VPI 12708) TaxID=29347 RepID=UPI001D092ABC|nr:alcohol dehydrogenase catalytic domain-containing protein [[Clostridium] scindens]MCB6287999.1 alcohol dehydrogenase catalytic domain-containing protein [[Clostridium] scindens]MCB6421154.1 alcohol dehydrogenase catalytic domain-containing protein [[Clostridium] scindens]MCB7194338.1 alcohol dehydrogenase catalytic domain-containing protein [[Clostridium] scindens]MCB7287575.1 alcohol dehydrogenase catalytic domain-containing protein [[Clostridium] scindens]MCG4929254.1 alcohol dehydrogenas
MTQAIMTEPGNIIYQEVDIPEAKPDQIKVKMKRIGICGSDIHVNHGKHPYTSYPVVQGHEVSAEVVETGKDVTNCKVGDKVTIQPQVVCGKCYPCTHGMYNDCEVLKVMGFQTTGMASDYFVVDANKALVLPEEMSWDHGAMIEPLAVAVHAVRRYAADMTGKKAVVLGGGPIGNLVAQTAKALGAEVVLLSELSAYRLDTAKKCGIATVNPSEEDLLEAIIEACGEDRADVIFECIGINPTMKQAIAYARKGSHIVVVGVFGDLATVDMAAVQDHELTLLGSAMYREEDYIKAIELVAAGKIEFEALITHRFGFREFKKGYDTIDLEKDKAMKVMINMEA